MSRDFKLIDVFHDQPLSGNPLAVVLGASDLETDQMQAITRWLNLSETTFLLPPTEAAADYRVRIFTLDREMPFAGHPTLGTCHAWLEAGGRPKTPGVVVQQCGLGLVNVRADGRALAFAAPSLLRSGPLDEADVAQIARVLRIDRGEIVDAQWADNGPGWKLVRLKSAEAVLALSPAGDGIERLDLGVVGAYPQPSELAYEVRAFFTAKAGDLREDPVTGSLNASVAQVLTGQGLVAAPYVASQGAAIGRAGRIFIDQDAHGQIWVGGRTQTLFSGRTVL